MCLAGDGEALGVAVGVADGVSVGVADGAGDEVAVGVAVGVAEGAGEDVAVGVALGAGVGEGAADEADGDGLETGDAVAGTTSATVTAVTTGPGRTAACAWVVPAEEAEDAEVANPAALDYFVEYARTQTDYPLAEAVGRPA